MSVSLVTRADLARSLEVAWLNSDGTIQTQIAATIAGVYACAATEPDDQRSEQDIKKLTQVATDISAYLSTGRLTGTLSGLAIPGVQQWITQHQEQLHTCTLAPDDLPGTPTR